MKTTFAALAIAPALLATTLTVVPSHAADATPTLPDTPLAIGAPGTPEIRTVAAIQPGVSHTIIQRGNTATTYPWAVDVAIEAELGAADAIVARLARAGFPASAQPIHQIGAVDVADGIIGHRVRLDEQPRDKADADALLARVKAAGFGGRVWYTGWDGGTAATGPWTVHALTIDPASFTGTLGATFGPDIQQRETTSELARLAQATMAVNAGFFVFGAQHGAPGDPAGAMIRDGHVVSESIGTRPVLAFTADGRASVTRPEWNGSVLTATGRLSLDGINREPGKIRNCGGLGDEPTTLPLHDVTCTDADELIAYTTDWSGTTPAGEGVEVVVDAHGHVLRVLRERGVELRDGQRSIQGTGALGRALLVRALGGLARVDATFDVAGVPLATDGLTVVNGGPELVRDGRRHITQQADGMIHPGGPGFSYGWVLQRNPRTAAGVDARGRLVVFTIDGRQTDQLGASIPEMADIARSLGLVDAINLDGGGSTTMVRDGAVVNSPSDGAGERAVGDAIIVRR